MAALLDVLNFLPDGVIFVKDSQARYVYANETLLRRLHISSLAHLTGRTASDVFPAPLGRGYTSQDLQVLAGHPLTEHLELHLYPGGQPGWCLTTKRALHHTDQHGVRQVSGLVGLSRDLNQPQAHLHELVSVIESLNEHHAQPLTVPILAAQAGLSVSAFERQVKRLYGATPQQLLTRARLQAALKLLKGTDWPVGRVAVECGYADHSAFSRVFRATVGLSPAAFRKAGTLD